MIEKCPICDGGFPSQLKTYKKADFITIPLKQNIKRTFSDDILYLCPHCNVLFNYPYHTPEDIIDFYKDIDMNSGLKKYTFYNHLKHCPFLSLYDSYSIRYLQKLFLVSAFRDFKEDDAMLDIGAGYGKSFRAAQLIFPKMKYYAIEPDHSAMTALNHLGVTSIEDIFCDRSIEKLNIKKFDLILMSNTLDHLNADEIIPSLLKVRDMLTDDGLFLCIVKNYEDANLKKVMPQGTHLTLFNKTSLRCACERAGLNPLFLKGSGPLFGTEKHGDFSYSPVYEYNGPEKIFKKIYNQITATPKIGQFVKDLSILFARIYLNQKHKRMLHEKFTFEDALKMMSTYGQHQYGNGHYFLTLIANQK